MPRDGGCLMVIDFQLCNRKFLKIGCIGGYTINLNTLNTTEIYIFKNGSCG
jgi:hypothetical protein